MLTNPFDTQKIITGLRADLQKAEQQQAQKPSLDGFGAITWLKDKLAFYTSDQYQAYKRQNEGAQ